MESGRRTCSIPGPPRARWARRSRAARLHRPRAACAAHAIRASVCSRSSACERDSAGLCPARCCCWSARHAPRPASRKRRSAASSCARQHCKCARALLRPSSRARPPQATQGGCAAPAQQRESRVCGCSTGARGVRGVWRIEGAGQVVSASDSASRLLAAAVVRLYARGSLLPYESSRHAGRRCVLLCSCAPLCRVPACMVRRSIARF